MEPVDSSTFPGTAGRIPAGEPQPECLPVTAALEGGGRYKSLLGLDCAPHSPIQTPKLFFKKNILY